MLAAPRKHHHKVIVALDGTGSWRQQDLPVQPQLDRPVRLHPVVHEPVLCAHGPAILEDDPILKRRVLGTADVNAPKDLS